MNFDETGFLQPSRPRVKLKWHLYICGHPRISWPSAGYSQSILITSVSWGWHYAVVKESCWRSSTFCFDLAAFSLSFGALGLHCFCGSWDLFSQKRLAGRDLFFKREMTEVFPLNFVSFPSIGSGSVPSLVRLRVSGGRHLKVCASFKFKLFH